MERNKLVTRCCGNAILDIIEGSVTISGDGCVNAHAIIIISMNMSRSCAINGAIERILHRLLCVEYQHVVKVEA